MGARVTSGAEPPGQSRSAARHRNEPTAAIQSVTYRRDHAAARSARCAVREHLELHGTPEAFIADFELIVSELVTNVVLHGAGEDLIVCTEWTTDAATVTVDSEASGRPPDVRDWKMPAQDHIDGRGLAVVAAIATSVHVDETGGRLAISATVLLRATDAGIVPADQPASAATPGASRSP